jgi:MFS family permease
MAFGYGVAMTHQVAFVKDIGFTAMFASFLFLIYGVMSMAGRFCGFFSDIIGREQTYTLGCVRTAIGFLMLIIVRDTTGVWMLYVYAGCFGFFSGLNSPTYASSAADIFEGKHFGAILGFANIGYGLGNSMGAWLGGYIFDMRGNYISAFVIAIMMMGVGCTLLWIASPRKIRLTGTRLPVKTF